LLCLGRIVPSTVMKVAATVAASLVSAVILSGCGGDSDATTTSPPSPEGQNIVQLANATSDLSTLVQAVVAGDLGDTLSGAGPFTVFAPKNAAFAHLPDGVLDNLLKPANKQDLADLLKYHVVSANVTSGDLTDGESVATVEGTHNLTITKEKEVKVNFAVVTTADVMASNGVVHIVDAVLLPYPNIVEKAQATDILSTLVSAAKAADLVETLEAPGPFTVLAPNNDAFSALPAGTVEDLLKPANKQKLVDILTYHVIPSFTLSKDLSDGNVDTVEGKSVMVSVTNETVKFNNATVVTADILAMNGVVHVIDGVLMPPDSTTIEV